MADEDYDGDDAGGDYDDIVEEDNNIEEEADQDDDGYNNVQCIPPGQASGGVEKSKRITTRYMTKYERARVLANYPREVAQSLPKDFKAGVYYGWAQVDDGEVRKMVVNIGWCPFYQNKEMSVETHVMHKFDDDFYDSMLKICIVGYLRPEKNFSSLDELIEAIKQDIENASNNLEGEWTKLKEHSFFTE